jgi:serine/threonine-protein kinase HipA
VLGVDPERKYEADGGPGLKECAAVIRQHSSRPAEDLIRFIRWVGFNYLIGNADAHAKNVALLYHPEELRLAPHYDLVSTEVYSGLVRKLAMKLGRAWDITTVQRSDWLRLSAQVDVPWEQVRVTLLELAAQVRAAASGIVAASSTLFGPSPVYEQVAAVIARHTTSLERAMAGR